MKAKGRVVDREKPAAISLQKTGDHVQYSSPAERKERCWRA
jgi:hypothetical protein